ncbi:HET-domain-containing protein, partial [Setomelanomma holmii]
PQAKSIRLLHLQPGDDDELITCALIVVDGYQSAPAYSAISYCWGDPEDIKDLWCNGVRVAITTSLWDVLHRIRHSTLSQMIWADAVCINQNNNLERNQQVSVMRQIYHHASRIFVWAG